MRRMIAQSSMRRPYLFGKASIRSNMWPTRTWVNGTNTSQTKSLSVIHSQGLRKSLELVRDELRSTAPALFQSLGERRKDQSAVEAALDQQINKSIQRYRREIVNKCLLIRNRYHMCTRRRTTRINGENNTALL